MQNTNYFEMIKYKLPKFLELYLVSSKILKLSGLGGDSEVSFSFFDLLTSKSKMQNGIHFVKKKIK